MSKIVYISRNIHLYALLISPIHDTKFALNWQTPVCRIEGCWFCLIFIKLGLGFISFKPYWTRFLLPPSSLPSKSVVYEPLFLWIPSFTCFGFSDNYFPQSAWCSQGGQCERSVVRTWPSNYWQLLIAFVLRRFGKILYKSVKRSFPFSFC